MTTDLRARLTEAMAVDRPAPTPTPAPGLDLDAVAVTGCVALADECERLRCTVSALDLKVSDAMAAIATERRRREAVEIERDGAALDRRRHFALYTREHEINATLTTRIATLEAELVQARAHQCGGIRAEHWDACWTNRVDWRARAIAAESDAQQWRNAVAGSQEPGDPVIRAIAALLACTYLDKLPTPPDDDFRRELAVAARIAHDKRRTAAAQWAKVAPLIEELRRVSINDGDDPQELEALRNELIAATEVTP